MSQNDSRRYYQVTCYPFMVDSTRHKRGVPYPARSVYLHHEDLDGLDGMRLVQAGIAYSDGRIGMESGADGFPANSWLHIGSNGETTHNNDGVPPQAIMEFFLLLVEGSDTHEFGKTIKLDKHWY